ncbi:YiiX/YebB-like N1pC/P60 family cysteine hydrolase [Pseudomonas sp. NPDC089734]|uniref:YiiX/YebB-like N1pC/P60 family cysteine hydrolase n=1 Tax=Pseudomonas sp. NPDC089734 TaxID=3364469 RepID=UPI003800DE68
MDQVDNSQDKQFNHMAVRAGDIIFVRPRTSGIGTLIQWGNVKGQRILASLRSTDKISLKPIMPKFSHVMLGAGDGLIIHADGTEVILQVVSDALKFKDSTYEIYRNPGISEETTKKIAEAGIHYIKQKYEFTRYFGASSPHDFTQFCSRLVAQAYRVAGMPLSELPDHKVLPLDLHRRCQLPDWQNITADSLLSPLPQGSALESMNIPMMDGARSLPDFLDESDNLLLSSLQLQVRIEEAIHESIRNNMQGQDVLTHFCAAEFNKVRLLRDQPGCMDEQDAQRIERVLSQIDNMLSLAALPDLELLIKDSMINSADSTDQRGMYAGLPTNKETRDREKARETIRYLSYLLMIEIGLFSILAQYDQNGRLAPFRKVNPTYASAFFNALPDTLSAALYNSEHVFPWVTNPDFQATYRVAYSNVINALKCIYPDR